MSSQLDERIRDMMQRVVDESPLPPGIPASAPPAPLVRPSVPYGVVATAAVLVILVLIGGAGWLLSTGGAEVGDAPLPSSTSEATSTTVTLTTTVVPIPTLLSSHLEPTNLHMGDEIGFSQSNGMLWARDEDGNIAGYRDGAWQALPKLPDRVHDVAGTITGPVWAVTDSNLWYFEDGEWQTLSNPIERPIEADVEVDKETGDVWVLSGADLYRWDGVEMSRVGSHPDEMILDGIVVAGDGTIWGARDNLFHPWDDRLARFDQVTGSWVSARPLGGTQDRPATIASTPGGDLWVGLSDPRPVSSDPITEQTTFVLAYLDSVADEWTTYLLPGGAAGDIVADDEVVWFKQSDLFRFNGETLEMFSPNGSIDNLGLGNDGTLWVTIRYEHDGVYRLVVEEEPIA